MRHTNQYTAPELAYLYQQATEHGIGALEPADREAVRDYARQHGLAAPRKRKHQPVVDTDPATQSKIAVTTTSEAAVKTEPEPKLALEQPQVALAETASITDIEDEELEAVCTSIVWDNIPQPVTRRTRRDVARLQALALRKFGKPGIISQKLTFAGAQSRAYRINTGKCAAWQPKGAYRAYHALDPQHEGKYCVVAQYVGEAA